MICTVKDNDSKVIAYMEWQRVGPSGYPVEDGDYVWLTSLWVHPKESGRKMIKLLATDILEQTPGAKWAYFTREKHGDRMSRRFTRKYIESLLKGEKNV